MDCDLLQRLRLRDRQALAGLAERFGPALTRAAYLYLGDAHAAEDIAQDTLIAAWDAARRARPDTALRPWLFAILFNQCRKYRRSLWRRLRRDQAAGQAKHVADGRQGDELERIAKLSRAMAGLDEPLRAVIILRYEQAFSIAQAAAALGLPEGTVKSRTHSAIGKLKAFMEQAS